MAKKKVTIKFQLKKIDAIGYHLILPIQINKKKAVMVIDTGASQSVFDKDRIARILGHEKFTKLDTLSTGLGTSSMKSHSVTLPEMKIGSVKIENEEIIVLDLSHVNASYKVMGIKPIDGILGGDFLQKFKAIIDYGNKCIILNASKHRTKTAKQQTQKKERLKSRSSF